MPRGPRRRHSASVSRLKALISLIENFSGVSLVNAGSTSAKWRHVVPGWAIVAGKGTSTAIGALISTVFSSANSLIRVKRPAAGVGPAFWVTDSGNYWSVIHNVVNLCQSCTACGAYNSCSYCSSYGEIAQVGCNGYGNCSGSICNGGYSSCPVEGCLAYGSCSGTVCVGGYGACSNETCTAYQSTLMAGCAFYYTYSYTYCSSYSYTYKGGSTCSGYSTGYSTVCGSTYYYYAFLCYQYTTYYYSCCLGALETYYYTCCTGGYFLYYTSCCPGGFYDYTYTCCVAGTYTYYTYGCTGNSYGPSSQCGCASFYTYDCGCTDHHRIDLAKKENGTETVIASTPNQTTDIAGIKVVTSGDNVTASAYSDINLTDQIGSDISATNTGQKPKEHGIISKASSSSQGYTIDEFRVN